MVLLLPGRQGHLCWDWNPMQAEHFRDLFPGIHADENTVSQTLAAEVDLLDQQDSPSSVRPLVRSSALQNRSSCFLVCSGNHGKTDLVSFGHKSLFLPRPSKNCGKCSKCPALFSTILSLKLFLLMKILTGCHDLAQSHLPFPVNAYCFCQLPLLCQMACPKSCAFLFSSRVDAS